MVSRIEGTRSVDIADPAKTKMVLEIDIHHQMAKEEGRAPGDDAFDSCLVMAIPFLSSRIHHLFMPSFFSDLNWRLLCDVEPGNLCFR